MSQKKHKRNKNYQVSGTVESKMVDGVVKTDMWSILKNNWLILAATLILTLILYANSLRGDFVSDDYATIAQNPLIANLGIGFRGLVSTYMVNALVASLFGVNPLPYHLFSTMLFWSIVVLVLVVSIKLFGWGIGVVTTLLFTVHPVHVEAVSWISGKPYLFIAFYLLLAIYLYIRWLETEKWWYLGGILITFLLAFLTDNPRPFSLFLILPLITWQYDGWGLVRRYLSKYWWVILLVLGVFLVVAWPHIAHRVMVVNSGYNQSESIFYNPLFQYPTGITKYIQLLWLPLDLTLYHTMYILPVWLNWLVFISFWVVVIYFGRRDKRLTIALLLFLASILPSMAPVKVSWLVAERYAFLASWGWCVFLAVLLEYLVVRTRWLGYGFLIIIVSGYGIRLVMRNVDWQTNHNLWVNTCQVSPNSHNAWNNIGDDYDKLKDYENAIKGFTQSTVVKPDYADAYHNRANIFFKIGRLDLARDSYTTAIGLSPGLYQTYYSLVQIDLMEGRLDQALTHAQMAMKVSEGNPQTHYVMGVVMLQAGRIAEARSEFEYALKLAPNLEVARKALLEIDLGRT